LRSERLAVALGELGDEVGRNRCVAAFEATEVARGRADSIGDLAAAETAGAPRTAQQGAESGWCEVVEEDRDDARRGFVGMIHISPIGRPTDTLKGQRLKAER